jgi:PAS domain S-box-containing protein
MPHERAVAGRRRLRAGRRRLYSPAIAGSGRAPRARHQGARMNQRQSPERFFAAMQPESGLALFAELPDVCVFVKDLQRRFVHCNLALARRLGCRRAEEVVGQLDEAFSPKHLCEIYAADDQLILSTGRPLLGKLELVRSHDGSFDWYSTTKMAVRGRDGAIIGLAGVTRDIKAMNSGSTRFLVMAPVIEAIMNDYARPLTMAELAAKLGLSVSQFGRQFKKRFGTTPLRYLIEVRITAACELLTTGDLSIERIALATGFYDQSHFTNQFRRLKAMTPSRYREDFGSAVAATALLPERR